MFFFENKTPTEIIQSVDLSHFSVHHPYFYFDGYGHATSFRNIYEYVDNVVDESLFIEWCDEMGYLDESKEDEEPDDEED